MKLISKREGVLENERFVENVLSFSSNSIANDRRQNTLLHDDVAIKRRQSMELMLPHDHFGSASLLDIRNE